MGGQRFHSKYTDNRSRADALRAHEGGWCTLAASRHRAPWRRDEDGDTGSSAQPTEHPKGGLGGDESTPGACWGDGRQQQGEDGVAVRCDVQSITPCREVSLPRQLGSRGTSAQVGDLLDHCQCPADRIFTCSGTLEKSSRSTARRKTMPTMHSFQAQRSPGQSFRL